MRATARLTWAAAAVLAAGLPAVSMAAPPNPPLAAAATESLEPAKLALGQQIIAIIDPPAKRDATMSTLVDTLLAQYRASFSLPAAFDDPGLKQIMDRAFATIPDRLKPIMRTHLPAIDDAIARAYAREFSAGELTDIAAFGGTPAGQHYLQRSSALLSDRDVAAANTAYLAEIHTAAQQISSDVAHEVSSYLAKHPDIAAKLKNVGH